MTTHLIARMLILSLACLVGSGSLAQEVFSPVKFFESLANGNKSPNILEIGSGEVQFGSEFDWKEYRRSFKLLRELPKHTREIWKHLPEGLEDDRYVTTVATSSGAKLNVTTSEACRILVRETLTQPYLAVAPKGVDQKIVSAHLTPEFMDSKTGTKEWLLARKDASISRLQIEMCEWAKAELQSVTIRRLSRSDAVEWIKSIDIVIEKLEREESPVFIGVFNSLEDLSPESGNERQRR